MGGIVVPLQEMQVGEQQPLSLKSAPKVTIADEQLKQRSERFRQAKAGLEARMNTDEFKKMKWVKLARKKGIPCFEVPPSLTPTPLESIEVPKAAWVNTRRMLPVQRFQTEKEQLGSLWKEEYEWNLVEREVGLTWCKVQTVGGSDPRRGRTLGERKHRYP
jgi:hypothetical protein